MDVRSERRCCARCRRDLCEREAVSADQPSDVTIPDLTPGTTYVAYAVAASGEHAGEVESIDLPTVALSYDVDYTAQYAQGYYYGDRMSAGTGNYYFHLSQFEYAPVEGQEGEYPDAPGMDVVLDLYGAFRPIMRFSPTGFTRSICRTLTAKARSGPSILPII
jgi:hypothetical protein